MLNKLANTLVYNPDIDSKRESWKDRACRRFAYVVGIDRRSERRKKFNDHAKIDPNHRTAHSDIIQFYSGVPNIGNYLPVMGIREELRIDTDLWSIHDPNIDWQFINRHYSWAIIGGAGLLNACFEPFWRQFAKYCNLPFVVWGVGVCLPDSDDDPGVSKSAARPVLKEASLVNLRDDVTGSYYNLDSFYISPCPTVTYLKNYDMREAHKKGTILYSAHTDLVNNVEQDKLYNVVKSVSPNVEYTDNIERRLKNMKYIIDRYARSRLVVTTRLHGAIIAYALQKPYIAIPHDEKVRAFHRLYGNGVTAEGPKDLRRILTGDPEIDLEPIDRESVHEFGSRVKEEMGLCP